MIKSKNISINFESVFKRWKELALISFSAAILEKIIFILIVSLIDISQNDLKIYEILFKIMFGIISISSFLFFFRREIFSSK